MNNAAGMKKDMLVILNDNKMGICPRVGGLAQYLDKARVAPFYDGLKRDVSWLLNKLPVVGEPAEHVLGQFKDAVKTFLHGGMLFEEMGFRYIGPVDGHDLRVAAELPGAGQGGQGPGAVARLHREGARLQAGLRRSGPLPHAAAFSVRNENGEIESVKKSSTAAYTDLASDAVYNAMRRDPRVTVLTAAMCEGNKLQKVRDEFPDRFFDTGICEGHAVAFAAGMAKAGLRPIVDIYSTFLQRSYDQIFQEVALQNLPVTFCLDRAGLCGPDGPTHHGVFDNAYMRCFPNMVLTAPGDALELGALLDFALAFGGPVSIRYPKANAETVERAVAPVELGRAEVIDWGTDGTFIAYGALLGRCVEAARRLRQEGLDVGVVNARFAKPLDTETILRAIDQTGFVLTVEENTVCGGFGSAVLEAAAAAGAGRPTSAASAFPTASSSTANATSFWRTWVSTSTVSSPPHVRWPTGRPS